MLPGPSGLLKYYLWFAWFVYSALLLAATLTGITSVEKAIFYSVTSLLLYLSWSTGFYTYIFSASNQSASIFTKTKGLLIRFSSSLVYGVLFLGFFFFDETTRYEKALYMTVLALLSLIWAITLFSRIRLIEDTCSTQLGSAAQGYAELEGKVRLYDGESVRGPHKELPIMLWYGKNMFSSSAGFILEDEKGSCTIDPRDAEVITPRYHFNEHSYDAIYPEEKIYVLGYLETLKKHRTEYERRGLIRSQLVNWKQNQFKFLNYFDNNHDGKIDEGEMANAVSTATKLIDNNLEEVYQQPATHTIYRPDDGRPFILSSIHPENLVVTYKRALSIHLIIWLTLSIFVLAMQVS